MKPCVSLEYVVLSHVATGAAAGKRVLPSRELMTSDSAEALPCAYSVTC